MAVRRAKTKESSGRLTEAALINPSTKIIDTEDEGRRSNFSSIIGGEDPSDKRSKMETIGEE